MTQIAKFKLETDSFQPVGLECPNASRAYAITPQRLFVRFEVPEGKTLYFPARLTLGGPALRAAYVDSLKMDHLMSFTAPVPGATMHHRQRHSQRGIV